MLTLIKGNRESLEGKALIYCRNLYPGQEAEKYPAIFVASNIFDLSEIMGLPITEDIHRLNGKLNEQKEKLIRETRERYKIEHNKDPEHLSLSMQSCEVLLKDHPMVRGVKGDVVYGGEIYHSVIARLLLKGLTEVYMAHYNSQLRSNLDIPISLNPTISDRFSDVNSAELRRRIYDYSGRLVTAVDQEDSREEERIRRDLCSFTQGASFFSDVVNLVGATKSRTPNRLDLLERYVDKICAIYEEDFEKAAKLKREIESLS